jgi:TonB family protein
MLGSIIIPEGVKSIGNNAFSSCHLLSSIVIPEGVKSIGSNAFYNCKFIESIVLPNSLETIDFSTFAFCPMLKNVYCYAENTPSAKPNAFDGSNLERAVLHVPDSSIDSYKAASPWNKFSNIANEDNNKNTSLGVQATFDLNGRSITGCGLPVPANTTTDEGRVVVNITVNPSGEVIATSINRHTNTVNPDLRKAAEDAAKRARFNPIDGVDSQTGTIIYYFKLR